ncbi:MAG: signal peptidase II, partial [Syntrophales bacterium]
GIGNLIDRILNDGAVIDFMNIEVGGLRTGIFNIADVVIMLGAGMLVFIVLRNRGLVENSF